MSVYVGIDMHRKRSQIAVVDEVGEVEVNRNVPNGVGTVLGVIGDLELPGVGVLTALVITAEVGDITRFPSARKLASWAGLTPTVRNSDRTVRHGHISKQGSPWLRWIMCEAARQPNATRPSRPPTRRWPTAAARRSPPPRSPANSSLTPTTSFARSTTGTHHRAAGRRRPHAPGELAFPHETAPPNSMT